MEHAELFEQLSRQVVALDTEGVEETTREALAAGVSPQEVISRGLAPGMERVGEGFEQGEFFVPELLLSARAMRAALEVLRPHLGAGGGSSAGKVVLGTVQGDVHKIGKSIVGVVLEGDGFRVHDLGEDVQPRLFIDKALEVGADVVGLSALISLAVSKMAETVSLLKQSGFAGSVIVGGAAVTPATADTIGADAFAPDAWDALRCVRKLLRGEARA
jgi:5-methyltetrahydrofolate--homocysteine methyltransferase